MHLKTQFLISIAVFAIILTLIGSSVVATQFQMIELNSQEAVAHDIQTGASNLNYISNNYFLYQSNSSLDLWQKELSTLSVKLAQLNSTDTHQQTLVNTVNDDMINLNSVFSGVTAFLSNAPRNQSVRILPSFQTQWDRMAVQIQALAFDSQQLSQAIKDQSNQTIITNSILTFALMALFGVFFGTIYLLSFRRAIKSINKLRYGIQVIGSGNLDQTIIAGNQDEISDISKSVNQMASNLKAITASKIDLEREIEERKKAEQALRESEERFSKVFSTSPAAISISRLSDGLVIDANEAYLKLFGFDRREIIGHTSTELGIISSKSEREKLVSIVLGKSEVTSREIQFKNKKGEIVQTIVSINRVTIRKEEVFIAVIIDITERKKAEEALKLLNQELDERVKQRTEQITAERQRLYNVLETLPAYVILLDKDHHVNFANKIFRERFDESHGKRCHEYLFNLNSECQNCETYKVYKENKPQHWYWTGPDGRNYDIYDYPFKETDGSTLILEMGIDITEQKKMEKQVKDSERMAAIGATAGMVGHDIRNPLQAVSGEIYLLKSDLNSMSNSENKESMKESVENIEESIAYINKIVMDLQDFARPIQPVKEDVDVQKLYEDLMLRSGIKIPNNISATFRVEKETMKLNTDPALLKRILINLVNNAIQAMPNGGKLDAYAYQEADDAIFVVQDTGSGIPEAIRPTLFTPLVTTKSKGQGFGLAAVKRLTEALGGTISFETEVGKGTKFIITLPS